MAIKKLLIICYFDIVALGSSTKIQHSIVMRTFSTHCGCLFKEEEELTRTIIINFAVVVFISILHQLLNVIFSDGFSSGL